MLLSRKEKEKLVVKLANEGKTTREIAKIVHISLRDIGTILRKAAGDKDPAKEAKEEEKQYSLSDYAKSFKMFRKGKSLPEIVIELDLDAWTIQGYYYDYLRLLNMNKFLTIYLNIKDDLPLFLRLYYQTKKKKLNREAIIDLIENECQITYLESRIYALNDLIGNLTSTKIELEQDISRLGRMRNR